MKLGMKRRPSRADESVEPAAGWPPSALSSLKSREIDGSSHEIAADEGHSRQTTTLTKNGIIVPESCEVTVKSIKHNRSQ